jgi:hypothetical protein
MFNVEELIEDIKETVDPEFWQDAFEDIYESLIFFNIDIVESPDDI